MSFHLESLHIHCILSNSFLPNAFVSWTFKSTHNFLQNLGRFTHAINSMVLKEIGEDIYGYPIKHLRYLIIPSRNKIDNRIIQLKDLLYICFTIIFSESYFSTTISNSETWNGNFTNQSIFFECNVFLWK